MKNISWIVFLTLFFYETTLLASSDANSRLVEIALQHSEDEAEILSSMRNRQVEELETLNETIQSENYQLSEELLEELNQRSKKLRNRLTFYHGTNFMARNRVFKKLPLRWRLQGQESCPDYLRKSEIANDSDESPGLSPSLKLAEPKSDGNKSQEQLLVEELEYLYEQGHQLKGSISRDYEQILQVKDDFLRKYQQERDNLEHYFRDHDNKEKKEHFYRTTNKNQIETEEFIRLAVGIDPKKEPIGANRKQERPRTHQKDKPIKGNVKRSGANPSSKSSPIGNITRSSEPSKIDLDYKPLEPGNIRKFQKIKVRELLIGSLESIDDPMIHSGVVLELAKSADDSSVLSEVISELNIDSSELANQIMEKLIYEAVDQELVKKNVPTQQQIQIQATLLEHVPNIIRQVKKAQEEHRKQLEEQQKQIQEQQEEFARQQAKEQKKKQGQLGVKLALSFAKAFLTSTLNAYAPGIGGIVAELSVSMIESLIFKEPFDLHASLQRGMTSCVGSQLGLGIADNFKGMDFIQGGLSAGMGNAVEQMVKTGNIDPKALGVAMASGALSKGANGSFPEDFALKEAFVAEQLIGITTSYFSAQALGEEYSEEQLLNEIVSGLGSMSGEYVTSTGRFEPAKIPEAENIEDSQFSTPQDLAPLDQQIDEINPNLTPNLEATDNKDDLLVIEEPKSDSTPELTVSESGRKDDSAIGDHKINYQEPTLAQQVSDEPFSEMLSPSSQNYPQEHNEQIQANENDFDGKGTLDDPALMSRFNDAQDDHLQFSGELEDFFARLGGKKDLSDMSIDERLEFVDIISSAPDPESNGIDVFCFVKGTDVLTEDGYKSIETIDPENDLVWTCSIKKEHTNTENYSQCELKEVISLMEVSTTKIVSIKLFNRNKIIETTPEHPFFVYGKGQINAEHLKPGMFLIGFGGGYEKIEFIDSETRDELVYNLAIEDNENYYIGVSSTGEPDSAILVHNCSEKSHQISEYLKNEWDINVSPDTIYSGLSAAVILGGGKLSGKGLTGKNRLGKSYVASRKANLSLKHEGQPGNIKLGEGSNSVKWKFDPKVDIDWRGAGKSHKEALDLAFKNTGVPKEQFTVTKWGKTADGKSFPAEYRVTSGPNKGAEVNIDWKHNSPAPEHHHVGYQTPGKRGTGGAKRGHILLDEVPYNR